MERLDRYLVFLLDGQSFALPISSVKRIARAVEITPLPHSPDIVIGVINVQGDVIPVVDVRRRFHLPQRSLMTTDYLIIGKTSQRLVALWVDDVEDISTVSQQQIVTNRKILPQLAYVDGVVKMENNLILIHDIERFLSLEEETQLAEVLESSFQSDTVACEPQ